MNFWPFEIRKEAFIFAKRFKIFTKVVQKLKLDGLLIYRKMFSHPTFTTLQVRILILFSFLGELDVILQLRLSSPMFSVNM